ncbi:MAG: hypothetical protein O2931_06860, partial [Planctomycetota bacterium]|nr:hypothetical protein [Planctomycetota bacterium]
GTFTLDANDSVADTVAADSAGTLNLHANTAAKNGNVHSGVRINTVAATNLNTSALVLDQGSLLNLGANLTLTEDIDIRGNGTSVATINANGRNITARNIYIGRFTHAGDIINDGAIVATGSLVARSRWTPTTVWPTPSRQTPQERSICTPIRPPRACSWGLGRRSTPWPRLIEYECARTRSGEPAERGRSAQLDGRC